jgi:hypothetical protein
MDFPERHSPNGAVIGKCLPRHRLEAFLRFPARGSWRGRSYAYIEPPSRIWKGTLEPIPKKMYRDYHVPCAGPENRTLDMISYLLISYIILIPVTVWLWLIGEPQGRRKYRIALRLAACLVLVAPVAPYIYVEAMSLVFLRQFRGPTEKWLINMGTNGEIRLLRVLAIGPNEAKIYLVRPCLESPGFSGEILDFQKRSGIWEVFDEPRVVWSDCGSASGIIFPPYGGKGTFQ